MVPPLANTFSSQMMTPTVTSALVDNLINNNPTQTTLSSAGSTTVTTSAVSKNSSEQLGADVKALERETNANSTDSSAMLANQFFSPPNASNELIRNELGVQQSTEKSSLDHTPSLPTSINQQFVQSEGRLNLSFLF